MWRGGWGARGEGACCPCGGGGKISSGCSRPIETAGCIGGNGADGGPLLAYDGGSDAEACEGSGGGGGWRVGERRSAGVGESIIASEGDMPWLLRGATATAGWGVECCE